ncbi:hypothetical protein PVAND_004756 [Polypedilum vanderplanki]|uniref:PIH1 domain-containing protein 1 n=1 Tax=Polypedilum vanderplanki TaxID=319348 RepID=A0A9J6BXW7_POLVA|nr:hypothetical protein PVAND_004756 [Polypedilum vanderplanki]
MLDQQETSIFEQNLRFVKNEIDEQLNEMFTESKLQAQAPFKMVRPFPGLCLKAFKKGTKHKFFINICHTDEIPAPKDITETELHKLIENQNATDFKVPLSVTKPRDCKDKNGNDAVVSDVAVNTDFFKKKIKHGDGLFYHFLITLIFESFEQKYKIELDTTNFVLLQNRLCFDKLVEHQIYNRDVKTVENYHKVQAQNQIIGADGSENIKLSVDQPKKASNKKLIEEISSSPYQTIRKSISTDKMREPEHRLFEDRDEFNRKKLIAEFYLPDVLDISELSLEANDDRILLESQKRDYKFDGFLPFKINEKKTNAEFDQERMILKITMSQ